MGDAGPRTPLPEETTSTPVEEQIREIHVLVTGFGPFKSFNVNPSWLIASSLPTELSPLPPSEPEDPTSTSTVQAQLAPTAPTHPHYPSSLLRKQPNPQQNQDEPTTQRIRPPTTTPYKITLHTYPDPVRVAYAPTAALIPSLLNPAAATSPAQRKYDYIFHIGLAGGRDSYTLETLAHREDYLIPDIDDATGDLVSSIWQRQSVPQVLHVGWHPQDVLRRWEAEVQRRQNEHEHEGAKDAPQHINKDTDTDADAPRQVTQQPSYGDGVREWMASHGMLPRPPLALNLNLASYIPPAPSPAPSRPHPPKKAVVKLSRDAGRFLCEFILMCTLVQLYLEATTPSPPPSNDHPLEKLGKVAFLHVPNGTESADVQRGRMVAESAIRSLVASWEGGYRNPIVYTAASAVVGEDRAKVKGVAVGGGVGAAAEADGDGDGDGNGFEGRGTGDAITQQS
ncbi:hypothetical protein LTR70_000448 [Exophiala xenobiotica]|uniref:Uncharacterized protein n=1 Tax=Lithohypha guttulata TaxID=1690604 RepID=A0ABR0KQ23_9EURO|nr:hypothetical protein LTR24_000149 [Lithohypha guttulata]KAK5330618.1 hypothetical protein LTR70_000448 [Exophiala xenobiotica]